VQDLAHRYGERQALDGINFGVHAGEIFGLLGPNGSGKTTLFRILSTLMLPSSGQAMILGNDVARHPLAVRRTIGIVHQQQSLDVKLTAAENLKHTGHLYGLSGAALAERIRQMLARVGLSDRADEHVEKLSGGMQRRVQLAAGLLHYPAVLLLDEPTTGLDPGARRDLWLYLDQLRREQQMTIVVTTHLMEEAEHCDRLAILSHGRLVALGTPADLKREIGGDVIVLEPEGDAERLAQRIRERFSIAAQTLDGKVRLEREHGYHFVPDLVEAFPGEVQSVSVSKPSLEDVFIRRTGHRFWNEAGAVESA
jgi:ABC-2 type transport system ATP-binding protein